MKNKNKKLNLRIDKSEKNLKSALLSICAFLSKNINSLIFSCLYSMNLKVYL